ncbi:hypothetical protein E0I03_05210 [Dickeya dadantii]|nr:hypothetical protein [Dickeya dadantii]
MFSEQIGYILHTSSCRYVGCSHSPRSLTYVSSRGSFGCRLPATRIILDMFVFRPTICTK